MADGVSQKKLAELLGLTAREIRNLGEKGLPRAPDGTYPDAACVQWYLAFKLDAAAKARSAADEETDKWRARKVRAEARKAELELATAAGVLVPVDAHRRRVSELVERLRAPLVNIPGTHAPAVEAATTPEDAQAVLEAVRDEALTALTAIAAQLERDAAERFPVDAPGDDEDEDDPGEAELVAGLEGEE